MRYFLVVALILVLVGSANAQWFWGKDDNTKIPWYITFKTTDNVADSLHGKYAVTTLKDSVIFSASVGDTNTVGIIYTVMLPRSDQAVGTGLVSFSLDSVNSAMDSAATLYIRQYYDKDVHPVQYWGSWHQLGGYLRTDSLYLFEIADSSWWGPASGDQFKLDKYDNDIDTATVNLGYYHN